MMNGLVFSRDRAFQLDATLRSFFRHCKNADHVHLTVLHKSTDGIHARQYKELSETYPNVTFRGEKHFRKDVLMFLNPYPDRSLVSWTYKSLLTLRPSLSKRFFGGTRHRIERKLILFLVDDNLFVRDFDIKNITSSMDENPSAFGFSLRLGKNTTNSYMRSRSQSLPDFTPLNENILKYRWVSAEWDFSYPFDVSSSVYRLGDFLPVLLKFRFDNPNLLEGLLAEQKELFGRLQPDLLCFETSVSFCNPINKVQNIFENRAGNQSHYSVEKLAELFDEGYRVDTENYNGFISNSCHQEVELKLERLHD